jgi:hypothetical protein
MLEYILASELQSVIYFNVEKVNLFKFRSKVIEMATDFIPIVFVSCGATTVYSRLVKATLKSLTKLPVNIATVLNMLPPHFTSQTLLDMFRLVH